LHNKENENKTPQKHVNLLANEQQNNIKITTQTTNSVNLKQ